MDTSWHPTEEQLQRWLNRSLPDIEAATIGSHLELCADRCRIVLERMSGDQNGRPASEGETEAASQKDTHPTAQVGQVRVQAVVDAQPVSPSPVIVQPIPATLQPAATTPEPVHPDLASLRPSVRDRIVVLGRRQSGKTIFLANLYAKLWRTYGTLSAKALSGLVHQRLMDTFGELKFGRWPAATLGNSRLELELNYHGEKHLMVSLDFAGEVFARAFLNEQVDGPEARELLDHIDRAAAVLLLVDPWVAYSGDRQAATEDDFGLVQAVQRIRDWPGGSAVPIVIVLTKMDQYKKLAEGAGGAIELVRRQFPALVRTLGQAVIFQVSATQVVHGPDGKLCPAPNFEPVNLEAPVKHCLRQMAAVKAAAVTRQAQLSEQLAAISAARRERYQNIFVAVIVCLLLGAGAVACWWVFQSMQHS